MVESNSCRKDGVEGRQTLKSSKSQGRQGRWDDPTFTAKMTSNDAKEGRGSARLHGERSASVRIRYMEVSCMVAKQSVSVRLCLVVEIRLPCFSVAFAWGAVR
jgi:hypothetical protein